MAQCVVDKQSDMNSQVLVPRRLSVMLQGRPRLDSGQRACSDEAIERVRGNRLIVLEYCHDYGVLGRFEGVQLHRKFVNGINTRMRDR